MMDVKTLINCALMLVSVFVIAFLITRYNDRSGESKENFYNEDDVVVVDNVIESQSLGNNESPANVPNTKNNVQQPEACYPRSRLTAKDLLSQEANTLFSQVNPSGQGDVDGLNFLTAGAQIGLNSVGTSLRNANRQLRSEPPNPQVKVCPWNISTIGPNLMQKSLEIGSGPL